MLVLRRFILNFMLYYFNIEIFFNEFLLRVCILGLGLWNIKLSNNSFCFGY